MVYSWENHLQMRIYTLDNSQYIYIYIAMENHHAINR